MILLGWKFHYSTRFCWRKLSNGGGDESRDVEALLSFKKTIKFDPAGYLCNWAADNSDNKCSWNALWCRKHTKVERYIIFIKVGRYSFT
jgi:hypothetical protein